MDNKLTRLALAAVFAIISLIVSLGGSLISVTTDVTGYVAEYTDASINAETQSWDLVKVQVPEAWQIVPGGKGVVVAVLDTGIDASHEELKGKVIGKANFTTNDDIDIIHGHGTFVAGIIAAAVRDNGTGGVAYNCSLLDVKVAEDDGITNAQKVADGIIWAADHGANIINISVVISKPYPYLEYAVQYAWEKGTVIVAAAGNSCSSNPVYPAAYPHVIAVEATDSNDNLAKWASTGDWVDVAAPGENIYSTLPNNSYGYKNGSSFSTALVSGEAALLFARTINTGHNLQINEAISNAIIAHGDDISTQDNTIKRINVYNAIQAETND